MPLTLKAIDNDLVTIFLLLNATFMCYKSIHLGPFELAVNKLLKIDLHVTFYHKHNQTKRNIFMNLLSNNLIYTYFCYKISVQL